MSPILKAAKATFLGSPPQPAFPERGDGATVFLERRVTFGARCVGETFAAFGNPARQTDGADAAVAVDIGYRTTVTVTDGSGLRGGL